MPRLHVGSAFGSNPGRPRSLAPALGGHYVDHYDDMWAIVTHSLKFGVVLSTVVLGLLFAVRERILKSCSTIIRRTSGTNGER